MMLTPVPSAAAKHAHDQLAFFNFVGRRGHRHHSARPREQTLPDHLNDKMVQQDAEHVKIVDGPLLQWAHHFDVVGLAPQHPVRFTADGNDVARFMVHRQGRRLVEDDALAAHVDQNVGGAEVYANIFNRCHLHISLGRCRCSSPN
jgi:hypothetical protein